MAKIMVNKEEFLKKRGVDTDHVVYNMMNTKKPLLDVMQLLSDYEDEILSNQEEERGIKFKKKVIIAIIFISIVAYILLFSDIS